MKKNIVTCLIFAIAFALTTSYSYANDSTLFQKRIEKIKVFGDWLKARPDCYMKQFNSDTIVCWKIYDTAIQIFLDKKLLNPSFNIKFSMYAFDYMISMWPLDRLILKKPHPLSDTLIKQANFLSYFKNTIIIYLPMYGMEFEGFYFAFAPNSDKLLYLLEAGGRKEDYLLK